MITREDSLKNWDISITLKNGKRLTGRIWTTKTDRRGDVISFEFIGPGFDMTVYARDVAAVKRYPFKHAARRLSR